MAQFTYSTFVKSRTHHQWGPARGEHYDDHHEEHDDVDVDTSSRLHAVTSHLSTDAQNHYDVNSNCTQQNEQPGDGINERVDAVLSCSSHKVQKTPGPGVVVVTGPETHQM